MTLSVTTFVFFDERGIPVPLNHLPLKSITRAHIDALIENGEIEDRRIEYKAALPAPDAPGLNELCYDVTAFANALGGDLLYGVSEKTEDGKTTGIPEAARGLPASTNVDEFRRRLEGVLSGRVTPRLTSVDFWKVDGDDGPIIIVRVPRSWAMPHLVRINDTFKCYIRRGGGKGESLDVNQLREAFVLADSLPQRVREFRDKRVAMILGGATPVTVGSKAKLAIHIVSLAAFESGARLKWDRDVLAKLKTPFLGSRDVMSIRRDRKERFNLDGFLFYSLEWNNFGKREWMHFNYVQLFRAGMVEIVDSLDQRRDELPQRLGGRLMEYIDSILPHLAALEFHLPAYIMITLFGVQGRMLYVNGDPPAGILGTPQHFDRDPILIPEVLIEELVPNGRSPMVDVLDALWQAGGFSAYFENY